MNGEQTHELRWFKSTYSSGEGGACVEIAYGPATVHVRDSKEREGRQAVFTRDTWASFLTRVGRPRPH